MNVLVRSLRTSLSHCQRASSAMARAYSTVVFNQDRSAGRVRIPGLAFDDVLITRDGLNFKPRMWRVMCLIDQSKEVKFMEGFLDLKRMEETHYTYIMCANLERFVPYEVIECKGTKPYSFSFDIRSTLTAIGKTSFQIDSYVADTDEKDLFKYSVVLVCVDRNTRKVEPVPDWFVKKFSPKENVNRTRVEPLVRASKTFSHPILVSTLDLDYYGHANNTAYVKYVTDSVTAAINARELAMTDEDAQAKVKNITQLFLKDCKAGDRLTGDVWMEGNQINCIIKNEEGKDLYHQSMVVEKASLSANI